MEVSLTVKLLFWLIMLIASVYYFIYRLVDVLRQRNQIKKYGEKTIATIVDYKTELDVDGMKMYMPVLEFTTTSGRTVTVDTTFEEAKMYKYPPGKQLEIFYLPENPETFHISGAVPLQAYLLVFGIPIIICTGYFVTRIVVIIFWY